jgi:arsenate reductase-like glutaredoxin family protein
VLYGGIGMNIQIFGSKKSFDTKKTERYFKERKIPYQYIDMKEKGMSKGEFNSVMQAVGGIDAMIDPDCKDKELLTLLNYLMESDKTEKVFENQVLIKTPVVRNGKKASIGFQPEIWKSWE